MIDTVSRIERGDVEVDRFEDYQEDYSLLKDWVFPFRSIPYGSKILLYGAGDVGQTYYEQLLYTKYATVVYWVDKQVNGYLHYLPIVSLDDIIIDAFDYAIIGVADAKVAREISKTLVCRGIALDKIIWVDKAKPAILNSRKNRIEKLINGKLKLLCDNNIITSSECEDIKCLVTNKDSVVIPRLVVIVTTKCTLKCEYCNNLMPYYGEKAYDIPWQNVIYDLTKVLDNIDLCISLELIGGEPFLYPGLRPILEYVLNNKKISEVEITTNATIIPSKEICEILQKPKIHLFVSHYKCVKTYSKFLETIKRYNIRHQLLNNHLWIDSGLPRKHQRTNKENMDIYMRCGASYDCKTLLKGKIHACARGAHLYDLGYYTDENDCLDLYSTDDLKVSIKDFYLRDYTGVCDYCTMTDYWRVIPSGEQKKTIVK